MIIELLIVLLALYVGSRYGSLALGAISGIGLAILVFGFGLKPGTPPTDVIYIIIAAVTCAGILQASGGMDWLIQIAERLLRKHPDRITFLAPLCTFTLTVLVGTGHVVYTLMPIIVDIAIKKGIRPERPCGVASIASQVGITCSPIAAAVVAFVTISNANGFDVTIPQVLMVTIPACVCGLMCAAAPPIIVVSTSIRILSSKNDFRIPRRGNISMAEPLLRSTRKSPRSRAVLCTFSLEPWPLL